MGCAVGVSVHGGPGIHLEMSGPGSRAHMEKNPGSRAQGHLPPGGGKAGKDKAAGLGAKRGCTGLKMDFAAVTAPTRRVTSF